MSFLDSLCPPPTSVQKTWFPRAQVTCKSVYVPPRFKHVVKQLLLPLGSKSWRQMVLQAWFLIQPEYGSVLRHNGWSCNVCVSKRSSTSLCIPKQSKMLFPDASKLTIRDFQLIFSWNHYCSEQKFLLNIWLLCFHHLSRSNCGTRSVNSTFIELFTAKSKHWFVCSYAAVVDSTLCRICFLNRNIRNFKERRSGFRGGGWEWNGPVGGLFWSWLSRLICPFV